MAEQLTSQQPTQDSTSATTTLTLDSTDSHQSVPTVQLTLRKPRTDRKVQWTTETIDNEHMDKKKSKCCCIYKKPKAFDESSSDSSDDECDHCQGHVEKKHQHQSSACEERSESASETVQIPVENADPPDENLPHDEEPPNP
ncbi:PREDICTED: type 1 phosphatases regulator ypi1 [Nicrophorus vespilloides]|uniref:E3 ubiquitin-protein ligase PPP1R11 n=1 Tax=Nicrophorus vespilloides TaxID=110193 RepID=A0ABM1N0N4_NICVS|nr:PREDICTED: type 1 phosphatases regulator ypi1 [Nicrophorus vespilloides]